MTDLLTQTIIPIWLRDTYARVQPEPLLHLEGHIEENRNTEIEAAKALSHQSLPTGENLFLRSSDIFAFLSKHAGDICDQTVAIIIRGLRDLYWNNRFSLSDDELIQLDIATRKPLPSFKNVFEYSSLEKYRDIFNTPMFQLFGDITEYNVINVPVKYFIESLNNNVPIQAEILGTGIIIQFDYEMYDFWDPDTESIINHIDLKC
jgi:hypothetical protein